MTIKTTKAVWSLLTILVIFFLTVLLFFNLNIGQARKAKAAIFAPKTSKVPHDDNNKEMAQIRQMIESAFLAIDVKLDSIERKQSPPHLATRWISPQFYLGDPSKNRRASTIVYIVNPGFKTVRVEVTCHRSDQGINRRTESIALTIEPGKLVTTPASIFIESYGWLEIDADNPVLPTGVHREKVWNQNERFWETITERNMTWYPIASS
jgi:hypothetical protein